MKTYSDKSNAGRAAKALLKGALAGNSFEIVPAGDRFAIRFELQPQQEHLAKLLLAEGHQAQILGALIVPPALTDAEALTGEAIAAPLVEDGPEPEDDFEGMVEAAMGDMDKIVASTPANEPKAKAKKAPIPSTVTKPKYQALPADAPNLPGFPARPIIASPQNQSQQKVIDQLWRAVDEATSYADASEALLAIEVIGTNTYARMALRYQNALLAKLGYTGEPRRVRKREAQ